MTVKPARGYVYAQEIKTDSGVVMTSDMSDTRQYYKILVIGEPSLRYYEIFSLGEEPDKLEKAAGFKAGDTVIIQKHAAEGDTPLEMLNGGHALFPAERIMAVVDDK